MFSLRFWVAIFISGTIAAQLPPSSMPNADYLDEVKEFSQHNVEDAAKKYREKINKMDMLVDYPKDHDYDDYDDEDDDDDDYEDEDEDYDDEDDDDEEGGGCGGGDDDEDDEDYDDDEESSNPVLDVIDEFFTR
ncbi:hypothetical protein SK128_012050 [Halocaridina rubra]|uniref:Uncharacterized protein n=1 Tax=Halocaridina rubra TaxID=373956 RepID=A0AAN8WLR5_HALRR